MDIKIHITTTEGTDIPVFRFLAYNEELHETIMAGYGATPYDALHDLVHEFQEAEIFRADYELKLTPTQKLIAWNKEQRKKESSLRDELRIQSERVNK